MSDPALKELLRDKLLQLAETSGRRGMTLAGFRNGVTANGFTLMDEELATELDYLTNKGLLTRQSAALSAGLHRYSLTAAGREYLEANHISRE